MNRWEDAYVVDRRSGQRWPLGSHYGDPTAALIAPDQSWFLSAGEGVVFLENGGEAFTFLRDGVPQFVHSVRVDDAGLVRILIDPWSESAAVWLLDPKVRVIHKLRDGPHLKNEPYREHVEF